MTTWNFFVECEQNGIIAKQSQFARSVYFPVTLFLPAPSSLLNLSNDKAPYCSLNELLSSCVEDENNWPQTLFFLSRAPSPNCWYRFNSRIVKPSSRCLSSTRAQKTQWINLCEIPQKFHRISGSNNSFFVCLRNPKQSMRPWSSAYQNGSVQLFHCYVKRSVLTAELSCFVSSLPTIETFLIFSLIGHPRKLITYYNSHRQLYHLPNTGECQIVCIA